MSLHSTPVCLISYHNLYMRYSVMSITIQKQNKPMRSHTAVGTCTVFHIGCNQKKNSQNDIRIDFKHEKCFRFLPFFAPYSSVVVGVRFFCHSCQKPFLYSFVREKLCWVLKICRHRRCRRRRC